MVMTVPPSLKPVTQFVRRAEKVDNAPEPEAPVVAYYCRLYAVEQAMRLKDNSEEGKKFLFALLTRLEEDKKRGMSQVTEEEGQQITMDWAMKEFNAADEEDRAGLADQNTARMFYASGVFFDVLRQFGEPDEEMSRRRMYCKWKASEILKAIKEGRAPTPGGAGEDVATGMPPADAKAPPTTASIGSVGADMGHLGSVDSAIPMLPGSAEPKEYDPLAGVAAIPEAPVDQPVFSPAPAEDYPTQPTYAPPSTPSYLPELYPGDPSSTTGGGENGMGAPFQEPLYPGGHGAGSDAPASPSQSWYVTQAPAPAPVPTAPPPVSPTPPPARKAYVPAPARPRTPVPSGSGSRRSGSRGKPQEGNLADAIEHCRYAIRALEHKNVDLAVQKLQDALQQIT